MKTIKIKCPNCGAILTVVDEPSNKDKSVKCPVCKNKHLFVEFKRVASEIEDDKTSLATTLQNDNKSKGNIADASIGYLLDIKTQKKYVLSEGINLIGRKTSQAQQMASVPIETDDRGFSRKHIYIEILKDSKGRIERVAYNSENKNNTTINGVLINKGDKIILHNNDVIKSANTELVFKER